METPQFYQPQGLTKSVVPTIRMALCGEPGTGKTTSALTFPNPVVIDFDNKLPKGTPSIPFWNGDFVATLIPRAPNRYPDQKTALVKWLRDNVGKFHPEQTLILDSFTQVIRAFDVWAVDNPIYTKSGEKDTRAMYGHFNVWCTEVLTMLKSAKCRVVVLFHLARDRDERGNLTGKFRPVAYGQTGEYVLGDFTHCVRCVTRPAAAVAGKPATGRQEYYWQVVGDNVFDTNGQFDNTKLVDGKFLPPTYTSIIQ